MVKIVHIEKPDITNRLHDAAFLSVFDKIGKINPDQISGIYMGYTNKGFIGFISYSKLNDEFLNLSFGGIVKEKRGAETIGSYRKVLEMIKEKTLLTQIESTNIAMLKISLHLGFEINGFTTINNIGYVNLIKNREVK